MSVANVAVKQRYSANGIQTSFAIPFAFIPGNGSSVTKVYKVSYDTAGKATETLMAEGTSNDYYLDPPYNPATGIDNQNVIFNVAPASGLQVLVIRTMPLQQIQSFSANPNYFKSVENALDIVTFLVQQLDEKIQRAPKFRMSGTLNDQPLPDIQLGGPYVWGIDVDGNIQFFSQGDLSFQVAFSGQTKFSIVMNSISNILTGYSFDGAKYSSVIVEFEVQQGFTVFTNGRFKLQYLNGNWQKVGQVEDDSGTPMGVTFGIQQTGTVVQLLASETGVGDAVIKLKKMYFLQ